MMVVVDTAFQVFSVVKSATLDKIVKYNQNCFVAFEEMEALDLFPVSIYRYQHTDDGEIKLIENYVDWLFGKDDQMHIDDLKFYEYQCEISEDVTITLNIAEQVIDYFTKAFV